MDHAVRVSAKELTALILDEERLRTERQDRKAWKSRVTGIEEFGPPSAFGDTTAAPRRRSDRRERRTEDEDAEYRLAIEASKYEAEEDRKRRERNSNGPNDDDLAKAIKLSKEEEELRKRELEESNPSTLFDDAPAPSTQPQPTGYNQGYQQQGAVDWDGNIIDQQQQQQPQQQQPFQQPSSTGFLNTAYSNPAGFASQPTGYQGMNGFSNGFPMSQSVFDQQQQYQQMQPQQQALLQPQSTAAFGQSNNPYAQAGIDYTGQTNPQQTSFLQAGSNNPWATGQPTQLDPLQPLPTGSNNPFASSLSRPQAQPQQTSMTTSLNTLAEQKVQTQFHNPGFNPATSFSSPAVPLAQPTQPGAPPKEQDPHIARLNALLSTGEGIDTFGNTGELRIPAQHTAPGTFVNSAGQNLGKLTQAQTGGIANPFFQQSQFTGMPPTTTAFAGAAGHGRVMPAQTGPANINGMAGSSLFGGGGGGLASTGTAARTNNPFGAASTQPQTQPHQSGSLIDF